MYRGNTQRYKLTLSTVHLALRDQAQDVVRSATDTVLKMLKSKNMKDFDKKKEVEESLVRRFLSSSIPQS